LPYFELINTITQCEAECVSARAERFQPQRPSRENPFPNKSNLDVVNESFGEGAPAKLWARKAAGRGLVLKIFANFIIITYHIPVTTQRNLSIAASFAYDVPIETQIPLIAQAGFNYISPGGSLTHLNYLSKEVRKNFAQLLARYRLKADTIHAPLTGKFDLEIYKGTAEAAGQFGADVVVVHCSPFEITESELASLLPERKKDCKELEKISRTTGVRFALENMIPGPASTLVKELVQDADPACIGFCYDSSHGQVDGPRPFSLLEELKDRLIAVHLSDRIKPFTDHVIPWEGFIHWDELCPILKTCNIQFPLLLEIAKTFSAEKDPEKFLKLAYQAGCRLWDMVFE
jgi:sugar phosphate isomerase/epimerase